MREQTKLHARAVLETSADEKLKKALQAWLDEGDDEEKTAALSDAVREALRDTSEQSEDIDYIRSREDTLTKKAIWMIGGDGWAYESSSAASWS